MDNERDKRLEQRLRFLAKHYKERSLDTEVAWRRFSSRHALSRGISFRKYWLRAAAVVLVLLGMGTWYLVERDRPDWIAIVSAPGKLKNVYLPDSSLVALAGDSWIRYDAKRYGKEKRAVEMAGKAFFEVRREEACPFSVDTRQTKVTVLGTCFQVDERQTVTEVNVQAGKVSFAATGTSGDVILTAGMSALYSSETKDITVQEEMDANKLAWKTRTLRFTDTPLKQVMADLEACYQVRIVNRMTKYEACLTATFHDLPLEDVLQVINQTLDVRLVADPQ